MNSSFTRLRRRTATIALTGVFLAASAAAYASEGAEAEATGGGMEALLPKMAEFVPALIAFGIVFLLLSKFAFPAITGMLDQRAETIREGLEGAENAKIEAERLLEEYKTQLAEARKEAAAMLAQAKQAGEAQRAESAAKAQAQYDDMLEKARQAIAGEKQAAIAELQASVAEISVAVAGKLIGSELSADDHLKIIEKYVSEAGSLNAN